MRRRRHQISPITAPTHTRTYCTKCQPPSPQPTLCACWCTHAEYLHRPHIHTYAATHFAMVCVKYEQHTMKSSHIYTRTSKPLWKQTEKRDLAAEPHKWAHRIRDICIYSKIDEHKLKTASHEFTIMFVSSRTELLFYHHKVIFCWRVGCVTDTEMCTARFKCETSNRKFLIRAAHAFELCACGYTCMYILCRFLASPNQVIIFGDYYYLNYKGIISDLSKTYQTATYQT